MNERPQVGKSFQEVMGIHRLVRDKLIRPPAYNSQVGFRDTENNREFIIQILSEVELSVEHKLRDKLIIDPHGVNFEYIICPKYKPMMQND